MPTELDDTVISILEDMLKADGTIESKQIVSSIGRGNTSISYHDNSKAQGARVDFVKDHESELRKYKKLKKLGGTV